MSQFCNEAHKKMDELTDNYLKEYYKRRNLESGIKDIEQFLFNSLFKTEDLLSNVTEAMHEIHLLLGDKD